MVRTNTLSGHRRARVIAALVDRNSIRSTVRMTGVARNTVTKLIVDLGRACSDQQHQTLRSLPCKRIQCDEAWAFVYQQRHGRPGPAPGRMGLWQRTWTAICADCKLVPSWLVGERNTTDATAFIVDLADRLTNRVQLTTDGHKPYLEAVETVLGGQLDYAQLIKLHSGDGNPQKRRYSPAKCTGTEVKKVSGNPDPYHTPPAT